MASGVMEIEPIILWTAIGAERAKALPAFHAFTGADSTGRFYHVGKATWLQVYMKADRDVISSLHMLSTETEVTETMLTTLASFFCAAYFPKGIYIKTIPELRWHLFCQKVTSYLSPLELWDNMSSEFLSKPEFGKVHNCSAWSSVGSREEWLPQGVRWPAETNHDRCSSSSKGHHWDG